MVVSGGAGEPLKCRNDGCATTLTYLRILQAKQAPDISLALEPRRRRGYTGRMSQSLSHGSRFIGRRQQMAELTAALDDSMSGQGRIVMLAGEPGVGKTRTAQELAVLAEQRGALVLWGWCYEGRGRRPTGPGSCGHNRPPVGGCQSRPRGLHQLRP